MKSKMLIPLIIGISSLTCSMVAQADNFDKDSYIQSVISILKLHTDAIRNLTVHEMKYSDNLVRHAVAVQKAFDLLGPMDWHAAESVKLLNKSIASNKDMNAEKFEKLAMNSKKALNGLVRAAHESLEEEDREGVIEALQTMMNSCDSCHAYLPSSVVPDVWGSVNKK